MDEIKTYELSDLDKLGFTKKVKVFICYELQPTAHPDELISSVVEGVRNATRQFPFMAGTFEFQQSGKLCIVVSPESQVEVNIRRFGSTEHKPFSILAKNSFSSNDLDCAQLLPEEVNGKNTVCALHLSLIQGGLILGFRMNHAAGDWASINIFLSLVCQSTKAYRDGLEAPRYAPDLNRTPYNTPAPDPSVSRQDLLESLPMFYVMDKSEFKPPPPPPPFQSKIYKIDEPIIQQLKARCAPFLGEVDYVTSYDCIAALAWRSITRSRLQLHPEKVISPSRFIHPIDVRTRDIENRTTKNYFGNAVVGCQVGPVTAQELVSDGDKEFATAAILIRKSISTVSLSTVGHMTSLIGSLSPTETLGSRADFSGMDVFMNSWYSGKAENYDIGAGSVPLAVRLDASVPGACAMILPNFSCGKERLFEVFVQLPVEEHDLLGKDAEFSKYFELVV
ncbi:hypothetical protein PENARI_c007G00048 [Penicillium arizonense]|uniref:Transferase n=1 Tax=Penicillium arizonense TaxID=1835702 RepID=A0A1F5LKS5_PENAI|nr:hypothetical protein PENARI_c007G00048 [Penicillium arizonense]OGE53706.1 hypothetical protein PENARI_c007G00048 [Penicillium arizonense]